jgi:protein SCO1/2
MSIAVEDENAPGGFDHSGWILLIDENRHIRSFCDGTDADAVTKFMDDIDWLLANNGK